MRTKLRPNVVDRITSQGFCPQPIHPDFLGERLPLILEGMRRITDNPRRHRHFPWCILPQDLYGPDQEIEYGLRLPEQGKPKKYVFHYVLGMEDFLGGTLPTCQYTKFLWALRSITTWSHKLATEVAARFDQENHGAYSGLLTDRIKQGRVVVRVLRYVGAQHAPRAQTHFDRSALTLHLHASHPGLVLFDPNGVPQEFPATNLGLVAIFPGAKFIAATGGAYGLLTPHGVRASDIPDDRYALVSFIHPTAVQSDVNFWRDVQPVLAALTKKLVV